MTARHTQTVKTTAPSAADDPRWALIVARDKIEAFSATDVEVNGKAIPIGRSYKELVADTLEKNRH